MLKGEKISLRAIEKNDLDKMLEWRNREDYRCFFREYKELGKVHQENWFNSKVINDPNTLMFGIVKNSTNELIGICGLCYINWINGTADLSLYVGENGVYIDEEGFAKETCLLLFKYAFEELRLNRLWTEIYEIDKKKIELYNSLNMNIDGMLRENYFHNGKYINSFIFSILKNEFIKN